MKATAKTRLRNAHRKAIFFAFIALVFTVALVPPLVETVGTSYQIIRIHTVYQTIPGIITDSHVEPLYHGNYRAIIEYRYVVNNATYSSDHFKPSYFFKESLYNQEASDRVAAHPVGSGVLVHYDPVSPATSVLDPATPLTFWLGLAACLLIGFIAVCLALSAIKTWCGTAD